LAGAFFAGLSSSESLSESEEDSAFAGTFLTGNFGADADLPGFSLSSELSESDDSGLAAAGFFKPFGVVTGFFSSSESLSDSELDFLTTLFAGVALVALGGTAAGFRSSSELLSESDEDSFFATDLGLTTAAFGVRTEKIRMKFTDKKIH